ncbi:right-handed parallel beta-helix repeat-containing protein [Duganella sp. sic0402]|uniref:right-handed parallel beta-helix repeat-containing protein n=1 Tax=Duganella sp. sic0402 TaxID=2854786 RepID=UPI001C4899E9|nr:right-handed parallel beta-helix repeat-containing protein [Duganella sp. sic0402]MBV7536061.1 right-handed parallel beta-helix repeat-containing protein [Duganella sp. sic0402]
MTALAALSALPAAWAAQPAIPQCMPLSPRSAATQDALIEQPGRYCVSKDFSQAMLAGGGHAGPRYGHALIVIEGGDVIIDLQQHTLHTAARSHGILIAARANRGKAERAGVEYGLRTRNVIVRNGVIDLRGSGSGVRFVDAWLTENLLAIPQGERYQKTRYVLENLTIKTDNVGIRLEGDGNIVRHCVIESDGDAAIAMAGPNSEIVNNTIVLGDPLVPSWIAASEAGDPVSILMKLPAARKQTRAAIILQQGSGAVIRGNRIDVKGKSATRHSIYVAHNSRGVLIEDNTFVGEIDAPVAGAASSTIMRANHVAGAR